MNVYIVVAAAVFLALMASCVVCSILKTRWRLRNHDMELPSAPILPTTPPVTPSILARSSNV